MNRVMFKNLAYRTALRWFVSRPPSNLFGRTALLDIRNSEVSLLSWSQVKWFATKKNEATKEITSWTDFQSIEVKNKETYLEMLHIYKEREKFRRGHVEFIYAALKYMEEFGVQRDLETYKSLIDILPKGKMIPKNMIQAEFMHYPKQQQCAIDLLEQMELNGVMPDWDMEDQLINVFGRRGYPVRRYWRMMYWMPKFKNASPWPLPDSLSTDSYQLGLHAIERITSIDATTKISVYKTVDVPDSLEDTWIISGQSPEQQELLSRLPPQTPVYVEGRFRVYLRNNAVTYFVLRADKPVREVAEKQNYDAGDWEEAHEKLAEITELGRQNVLSENGLLYEQVAAYILDDIPVSGFVEERREPPPPRPKPRPPPGFTNANSTSEHPLDVKLGLSNLKNVCTVEELERNLIKPPPANSLRLEDLERNLIAKPVIWLQNKNSFPIKTEPRKPLPRFLSKPPLPHHPVLNRVNDTLTNFNNQSPFSACSPLPPHQYILPPGLMGNLISNLIVPIPSRPQQQGPIQPQPDLVASLFESDVRYEGLMTFREKNWLASIQLLQLNTNQPFQEDYYYTMYLMRQSGNHGRKINNSLKNARDRGGSPTSIKPQYTPLQFENSLGKLQVGSVMAPRKIIDTDIVDSVESSSSSAPNNKKIKQILLEIEYMYALVLKAEDVLSPMNSHPDPTINPTEIFEKVVKNLTKEDKLRSVLNIRKGKTLVLRILPHTVVSEPLVRNLIALLPLAVKKDTDQGWLRALPAIRYHLGLCPFSEIVEFAKIIKPHVSYIVPNKFGISVIANMIERAEHFLSHGYESNEWLDFVSSVASQAHSGELERPVVGIHGPTLARHLSRIPANNHDIVTLQKILSNMSVSDNK